MSDEDIKARLLKEAEEYPPTDYRWIYIGVTGFIAVVWLLWLLTL